MALVYHQVRQMTNENIDIQYKHYPKASLAFDHHLAYNSSFLQEKLLRKLCRPTFDMVHKTAFLQINSK